MMNRIMRKVSTFLILVIALSLYLTVAWFLNDTMKLSVLVSNDLSFLLIWLAGGMVYFRYYIELSSLTFKSGILVLSALIPGLLIDGYFVNFFVTVGRFAPMVSIFFAVIISLTFIIAYNLLFLSKSNRYS